MGANVGKLLSRPPAGMEDILPPGEGGDDEDLTPTDPSPAVANDPNKLQQAVNQLAANYQAQLAALQSQVPVEVQRRLQYVQQHALQEQAAVDQQARFMGETLAAAFQYKEHAALPTTIAQQAPAQQAQVVHQVQQSQGLPKLFFHITQSDFETRVKKLAGEYRIDPILHPEFTELARQYEARLYVDEILSIAMGCLDGYPPPYVRLVINERVTEGQTRIVSIQRELGTLAASILAGGAHKVTTTPPLKQEETSEEESTTPTPAEDEPSSHWYARLMVPCIREGGEEPYLPTIVTFATKSLFVLYKSSQFMDVIPLIEDRWPPETTTVIDTTIPIVLVEDGPHPFTSGDALHIQVDG